MFNLTSYPNLVGMFEALGVATEPSEMSFALSTDGGRLEWGSGGLGALFAQRSNLLSPSFWRMLLDVVRTPPPPASVTNGRAVSSLFVSLQPAPNMPSMGVGGCSHCMDHSFWCGRRSEWCFGR